MCPKPEMVVKFVNRDRVTNALVQVVFGAGFTPEITLAYVRNGGDGFRCSSVVTKSYVSHMSKRAPGESYWLWPDEVKAGK
jgi:hypothetical protein